jgi:hypothetical protein
VFSYKVKPYYSFKLDWKPGQDTNAFWEEVILWMTTEFGLPSYKVNNWQAKPIKRWAYQSSLNDMIFRFRNPEDAMLAKLRWGDNK